jgi:hypothetical protein
MSTSAVVFLLASWTGVLGLTAWAFRRILKTEEREEERR